jgi:hypothetical protein
MEALPKNNPAWAKVPDLEKDPGMSSMLRGRALHSQNCGLSEAPVYFNAEKAVGVRI